MTQADHPTITAAWVLELMHDQKNRRRRVWTPSIVLERAGISFYPKYDKRDLAAARRALFQLWRKKMLVRRGELQSRWTMREYAFMRPEDAPPNVEIVRDSVPEEGEHVE